jgi:hypothetical protein
LKPATWLAIGGAAALATVVTVLVTRKRAVVTPPPAPVPPKIYGEATKVSLAVPFGWRRATSVEVSALPELASRASAVMNTPGFASMQYGTLSPFVASDGRTYATWIEQHCHPPGGAAQPWGLHHGVTVLAQSGGVA